MLALAKHSDLVHADRSWWTNHRTLLYDLNLALFSPFRCDLWQRVLFDGFLLLLHEHAHLPLEYNVELIAIFT